MTTATAPSKAPTLYAQVPAKTPSITPPQADRASPRPTTPSNPPTWNTLRPAKNPSVQPLWSSVSSVTVRKSQNHPALRHRDDARIDTRAAPLLPAYRTVTEYTEDHRGFTEELSQAQAALQRSSVVFWGILPLAPVFAGAERSVPRLRLTSFRL